MLNTDQAPNGWGIRMYPEIVVRPMESGDLIKGVETESEAWELVRHQLIMEYTDALLKRLAALDVKIAALRKAEYAKLPHR